MPAYDPDNLLHGSIAFRQLANGTAGDSCTLLATTLLQLAIVSCRLACSIPQSDAQPSFNKYLNFRRELVQDGLAPLEGAFTVALDSDEPLAKPLDDTLTSLLISLLEAPLLRALLPAFIADKSLLLKLGQHMVGALTTSGTTHESGNSTLVDTLVPLLVTALVDPLVEPVRERLQGVASAQYAHHNVTPNHTLSILSTGSLIASPKRAFGGLPLKGKENAFGLIRTSMTSPTKNPGPSKKVRVVYRSEAGSETKHE